MEDQYQYVGGKMAQENYMAKILKDGAGAGTAIGNELLERYKSAQESVRQADEDIKASKQRAAKGGAGVKIKEGAKRIAYNAKKAAALLKKRKAEASINDLVAALLDAQGSPLVNNETSTVVNSLNDVISMLRNAKTRTGGVASERGAPVDEDPTDELDDQYGGTSTATNWAY